MTPTPTTTMAPTDEQDDHRADLIQVDTALESMRDWVLTSPPPAGEPIDNSVEAGAYLIRVVTQLTPTIRPSTRSPSPTTAAASTRTFTPTCSPWVTAPDTAAEAASAGSASA